MKKYLVYIILVFASCFAFLGCKEKDEKPVEKEVPISVNNNVDNFSYSSNDSEKSLKEIDSRAKEGMILNVDFKAKDDNFETVKTYWGKEDKREFVELAKGTYATFSNKNTVFGLNKGEQIFEIRSFSPKLKEISLKDIIDFYGEPEYEALLKNDERIVGYKVSMDFKVEFVLKNSKGKNEEQFVDHYGVFYPKGTVNNMSGDKGREW